MYFLVFIVCLWKRLNLEKSGDGNYYIEMNKIPKQKDNDMTETLTDSEQPNGDHDGSMMVSSTPVKKDSEGELESLIHKPRTKQVYVTKDLDNQSDIELETTAWLLMTSFMAPIVCLGTHSGFVVIAWVSDPDAAGSMTIFFVLSFVYYYFGFRQLYIVLASRCKGCSTAKPGTNASCCCKRYTIDEADDELDEYHKNLKTFNFKALGCALLPTFVFVGAHGLSITAYVLLPTSLVALPSSLFNILNWALILGSGLIA